MNYQEAITIIKSIYPPPNYQLQRQAYDKAIEAMERVVKLEIELQQKKDKICDLIEQKYKE